MTCVSEGVGLDGETLGALQAAIDAIRDHLHEQGASGSR
jgi:hypothetical protein